MSSLLNTASVWTNDDVAVKPKKRIPTMRNAVMKSDQPPQQQPRPSSVLSQVSEVMPSDESSASGLSESIIEVQNAASQRKARINELLNNMENDGQSLGDFEPLDHPIIQKRTEIDEALQIPPTNLRPVSDTPFHPSSHDRAYPNYHQIYDNNNHNNHNNHSQHALTNSRYGRTASPQHVVDEKWMEKINYMIYLLEQQQNEKTNHITEEFVLYTFLGVFIIFVVDAFSRGGKYVR